MRRCQRSNVSGCTRNSDQRTPWEQAAQRREQRTILRLQTVPRMPAAQHGKLVAQHQDLDLLGLCRPEAEQDQLREMAQREADE
jgi:hypothetical protein